MPAIKAKKIPAEASSSVDPSMIPSAMIPSAMIPSSEFEMQHHQESISPNDVAPQPRVGGSKRIGCSKAIVLLDSRANHHFELYRIVTAGRNLTEELPSDAQIWEVLYSVVARSSTPFK